MKGIFRTVLLTALFVTAQRSAIGQEMVFCGWDEVFIAEVGSPIPDRVEKTWRWRAANDPGLPVEFRSLFDTTDDCKPVDGGRRILISSSGGGLAVVDRESGRAVWYGFVGNAHSIELLPNQRLAVAGSTSPQGNKLAVFDLKRPNTIVAEESLHSGHGVVWDQRRQLLWALGYDELRAYSLRAWETSEPGLDLHQSHHLPTKGGHDLSLMPGGGELLLTTEAGVYTFDIEGRSFQPALGLADLEGVKSVTIHSESHRLAYTQAEGGNWWTTRVRFLNPEGTLLMPDEHLYKVRWVHP